MTDTGVPIQANKVTQHAMASCGRLFESEPLGVASSRATWLVLVGLASVVFPFNSIAQTATEPTQEQSPTTVTPQPLNPLSSGPVLTPTPSPSLEPGLVPKRTWSFVPRITVGETFTDNVDPGSGIKRADAITEITPGFRLLSDTARLHAYADFQAAQYLYARGSYHQQPQLSLNTFGTFEAIEKRFYIDFSGNISQQSISAFGPQVASNAIIDNNRTELSTYRLSPYLRGRVGRVADYELRYASSWSHSNSAFSSNVAVQDLSARLTSSDTKARIGWTLEASQQDTSYSMGTRTDSERYRGLISYQFAPDFKISGSEGQESNNYFASGRQTQTTSGYGLDWTPTERTVISLFREKRFFGEGHNYTISHRTPLLALKYTDTKDVSVLPNQGATVGMGSIYDLYYSQLTSAFPDPVQRAQAVNSLLAQTGISPSAQVISGFLVSSASLLERQSLSVVLNGRRNTATLTLLRSVQSILGSAVGSTDFALASSVTQKGVSASWALRTTPLSSLTTTAALQESNGSGLTSRQKTLNMTYTTRIKAQTNLSAGFRTGTYTSNTISYRENAVLATLTARF